MLCVIRATTIIQYLKVHKYTHPKLINPKKKKKRSRGRSSQFVAVVVVVVVEGLKPFQKLSIYKTKDKLNCPQPFYTTLITSSLPTTIQPKSLNQI